MSKEEAVMRFKKANAAGFINQMVSGSGATAEQAARLFQHSDAKATRLLQKAATIRESILAEVNGRQQAPTPEGSENLPENLRQTAST